MMKNRIVKARHIIKDTDTFTIVSNGKELGKANSKEEALTLASKFINEGHENVLVKTNKNIVDNF